jgi:hypothetical protein
MRSGPYEIVAPIARVAWRGVQGARHAAGPIVAIKVSKERFSERFEREARAVAALNHGNICRSRPDPHLNQWVDLGLSGSVKSNAIVAQHDPASEMN